MGPLHTTSDTQSLLLTQAAVEAVLATPALLDQIIATLDHWDRVAPPASQRLRDEWRQIVLAGDWRRVLGTDDRGQQLRQASPLGRALSPARRLEIIRACKARNSST